MKNWLVLIVSESDLFADAISRLLQAEGMSLAARAYNLAEARSILNAQSIDIVLVDHDESQLQDAEAISRLIEGDEDYQVIFLTMVGNRMIIHRRERVEDVTPADLIKAIRLSKQKTK